MVLQFSQLIDAALYKGNFHKKNVANIQHKRVLDLNLTLINIPLQSHRIQETLAIKKHFEKISRILKKSNFNFVLKPSFF